MGALTDGRMCVIHNTCRTARHSDSSIVSVLMAASFEVRIAAVVNSVMQYVCVSGSVHRHAFWKSPAVTSRSPKHAARTLLSTRTSSTLITTPLHRRRVKGAPYVGNGWPEKGRFVLSQRKTAISLQSEQLRRVILSLRACVFDVFVELPHSTAFDDKAVQRHDVVESVTKQVCDRSATEATRKITTTALCSWSSLRRSLKATTAPNTRALLRGSSVFNCTLSLRF